jgi:putative transposase
MVTPAAKREAVAHLRSAFDMSERRACRTSGCVRMTVRCRCHRPDDVELRARPRSLAHVRPRFDYRRLHVLLRREGFTVNHKHLFRLYREERGQPTTIVSDNGTELTSNAILRWTRRDKRKTRRIASAVETQGVSPRPGPPMFLRDSATLVPDRGLGVRRVGRVLQDVTHEIERGVKRLVVLRIWRNIGLRAGLLVPFGLQVSAQ